MLIQVDNCQDFLELDTKLSELIEKAFCYSLEEEGFKIPSEVTLLLVDNEEIREINADERGIDKPTDVLSFPISDIYKGTLASNEFDKNPETGFLMLGDILISTQKAIEQAKDYGHSVEREIIFLLTHGIFHLLGYDHQNPEDENEMIKKQEAVLAKLGLTRSKTDEE